MIASSLPDEGKSFICLNLSKSLAMEMDLDVLLVDGDTSKRCLSEGFGLQDRLGLTDVLVNKEIDLLSAVVRTNMDRLFILPAGKVRDDVTELLSGTRMANIVSMLSSWENLVVVIDSAPLLLTVESRAMASLAGQIVMVVRAGETKQEDVLEAVNMIEGDKPINLVLNQLSTPAKNGMYYGAYYPPTDLDHVGPPRKS
jgi:capsular exopolysaccharide synthesis family protein